MDSMERAASDAERRLVQALRSVDNAKRQVEHEKGKVREAQAEGEAILLAAHANAGRVGQETQSRASAIMSEAASYKMETETLLNNVKAEIASASVAAVEEAVATFRKDVATAKEIIEAVKSLSKAVDALEIRKRDLLDDVTELEARKTKLDNSLASLGRKFETVSKGLER